MEIQPQPVTRLDDRRRRRATLLALLLGLSLLTVGAGAFSLAVFTASDTSDGSFTTGNVDLVSTPSTAFSVTGILPGDSGSAAINVANNGTAAMRYAMTSSATNADTKGLAAQMDLVIETGDCSAAGTELYNGSLGGAFFGDPAQGDDTDDRPLASGANEDLCFRWSLVDTTDSSFMDATTTATFTFAGEQTLNNP